MRTRRVNLLKAFYIAFGALLFSVWMAIPAIAWQRAEEAEGPLDEYISALRTRTATVFVAECQVSNELKAVLIFGPGEEIGTFVVVRDRVLDGKAVSAGKSGKVSIRGDIATAEIFGADSEPNVRRAYEELARDLVSWPFWVLHADRLSNIYAEPAAKYCSGDDFK
jgi:hypothetical protein